MIDGVLNDPYCFDQFVMCNNLSKDFTGRLSRIINVPHLIISSTMFSSLCAFYKDFSINIAEMPDKPNKNNLIIYLIRDIIIEDEDRNTFDMRVLPITTNHSGYKLYLDEYRKNLSIARSIKIEHILKSES